MCLQPVSTSRGITCSCTHAHQIMASSFALVTFQRKIWIFLLESQYSAALSPTRTAGWHVLQTCISQSLVANHQETPGVHTGALFCTVEGAQQQCRSDSRGKSASGETRHGHGGAVDVARSSSSSAEQHLQESRGSLPAMSAGWCLQGPPAQPCLRSFSGCSLHAPPAELASACRSRRRRQLLPVSSAVSRLSCSCYCPSNQSGTGVSAGSSGCNSTGMCPAGGGACAASIAVSIRRQLAARISNTRPGSERQPPGVSRQCRHFAETIAGGNMVHPS